MKGDYCIASPTMQTYVKKPYNQKTGQAFEPLIGPMTKGRLTINNLVEFIAQKEAQHQIKTNCAGPDNEKKW